MDNKDDVAEIDVPHWLEIDTEIKQMCAAEVQPEGQAPGDPIHPRNYVVMLTAGQEDGGKRATLAFAAACTAIAMDFSTRVFLIGDGGHWAYEGACDGVSQPGFPPLKELMESFLNHGGKIYLCAACDQIAHGKTRGVGVRQRLPKIQTQGLAPALAHMVGSTTVTF